MTTADLAAKIDSALRLIDRHSYSCADDLAEAIHQDFDDDEITEEQFELIDELVADWWIAQG